MNVNPAMAHTPINWVTTKGSNEKKITSPFSLELIVFTVIAIKKPNIITKGVTTKVNGSVNPIAL